MNKEEALKLVDALAAILVFASFLLKTPWLALLGAALLMGNVLASKYTYGIAQGFKFVQHIIGAIVSRVFLALVFYIIVVPVGFLYRVIKKDASAAFFKKRSDSYFVDVKLREGKELFDKQW